MKLILSPARGILATSHPACPPVTKPLFATETLGLAALLQSYSPWELERVLRTNPQLALQAWEHYQTFSFRQAGTPALLAYHGLVYKGIYAQDFTRDDFLFAGDCLRILSAFYGVLHPFHGISPYRLELISKLRPDGKSLYAFWGDKWYQHLFSTSEPVLSLCSGEYEKAVTPYLQPADRFITCNFLTQRGGKRRCITTSAKSARGRMARFVIKNRIQTPEAIQAFEWDGYQYISQLSDSTHYTFVRE